MDQAIAVDTLRMSSANRRDVPDGRRKGCGHTGPPAHGPAGTSPTGTVVPVLGQPSALGGGTVASVGGP
ncbi:hypothetical protein, partial [Streptomyces sp. UH6]|uniref:hypothetical protein n=1 Tax=Streptomyces sp. UH6 TaxID=2748379 RepID=UPI001C551304